MNGLVAYESSSDEEGADDKPRAQGKVGVSSQLSLNENAQGAGEEITQLSVGYNVDTANGEGGLLGPMMPEDVIPSSEQTLEQDLLRHLTQATHPMTSIPDSPPGSPDPGANARIQRFLELKARSVHFNEDLASKATFKNPSLLSTMMKRAGIEEHEQYSTSLPMLLWNPEIFPEWAYQEGLFKIQHDIHEKDEASRKAMSAAGKRTIEFASASNSAGSSKTSTPGQQNKRRRP